MKILVDLTSLADNFSGIERFALCIAKELFQQPEHEYIAVFKNEIHPFVAPMMDRNRVQAIVLLGGNKLLFNQVILPFHLSRIKADIYLFLAFPVPILLFKKHMFSTMHDICCWDCGDTMRTVSKWYFRISHRVAMLKCKAIITISKFSKRRIIERLHYTSNRIWLVYCAISDTFANFVYDAEASCNAAEKYSLPERYLLCLSTLEPRKNLKLLVQSYSDLIAEAKIDIDLVLAGRKGWLIDSLMENVVPEAVARIHFTGFIDDADLPYVYQRADCFVFPSIYEGFGIPPLEAMSVGTPVISSDVASMPEVLEDAAIYFKSNDLGDLKRQLVHFYEHSLELPSEERLHQQVERFTWKEEAERLLHMLESDHGFLSDRSF